MARVPNRGGQRGKPRQSEGIYKGVYKTIGGWRSVVKLPSGIKWLGEYDTERQAALVRDAAIMRGQLAVKVGVEDATEVERDWAQQALDTTMSRQRGRPAAVGERNDGQQ